MTYVPSSRTALRFVPKDACLPILGSTFATVQCLARPLSLRVANELTWPRNP